jgi:hypothetical protein
MATGMKVVAVTTTLSPEYLRDADYVVRDLVTLRREWDRILECLHESVPEIPRL